MQRRAAGRAAIIALAVTGLAAAVPDAWAAGAQPSAGQGAKQVDYQGFHARVPADWPVVDLAANPRTCVRFDVNAVYLGTPGADQDCPAHLAPGRSDGLLIQPAVAGRTQGTVVPGRPIGKSVLDDAAAGRQIQARLGAGGLEVTATYAVSSDQVRRILETASLDAGVHATAPAAPKAAAATGALRTDIAGYAFDRCAAPSDTTMAAWAANSPYRGTSVYLGGPAQACASPTKSWVDARNAEGWGFMPLYVGRQASIGNLLVDADPAVARRQGSDAADDAVAKAAALGFQQGSVLYTDMEGYDSSLYRDRVLEYFFGWTTQLHNKGYRSGVYTGAASGVKDLSSRWTTGSYTQPDVLWAAAWNSHHDVSDAGMGLPVGAGQWTDGRRGHQYSGNVTETYGGIGMAIDASYMDVTWPGSGNTLQPGRRLSSGQSLSSDSVKLTMQPDGNLVTSLKVGGGRALASTNTYGNPGAYAVMQDDGNLVVYRKDGGPGNGGALWASNTSSAGAYTAVQDDGNVVVYRRGGGSGNGGLWGTGTAAFPSKIGRSQALYPNQWIQSASVRMLMQDDGNLVIYRRSDGAAIWSTNTYGNSGARLSMQDDGNLVVYKADGTTALWSTGTYGNTGAYALLQDDANFVVYRWDGSPSTGGSLWASGTFGRG
ncbi:glycoside hydrolase domain-containing protein [Kitasatospora sp. CB01950]|uniref:glycoside hydrolase domain-containing protein n=1 Tax=Kitasatospora sp. CB01950 TaxID=1703930 RepID=UPI00093F44EE|nr:glycoside hydrolase domain-containing protein [Kitasatospora sp. CB01950]